MNGLTWFAARDLAEQRHPIRRVGWTWWILKRFNVWLLSRTDATTGLETLTVVQNTDFTAAEFLAKDWTDETFTGGSYPACTVAVPASTGAPNSSGGAGGWTLDASLCGGDGTGGGVPANPTPGDPVTLPANFGVLLTPGSSVHNSAATTAGTKNVIGYEPLTPDGSSCWIGTPSCTFRFRLFPIANLNTAEKIVFYIAPPGHSLSGIPAIGSTILSSGTPMAISGLTVFGPFPCADFFGTYPGSGPAFSTYTALIGGHPAYTFAIDNYAVQGADAHTWTGGTVTKGGTYAFRAINYNHTTGIILATADASYTFAPAC